eukprot:scaffold134665_cov15-Tisochrysis_lutea.AAC.1
MSCPAYAAAAAAAAAGMLAPACGVQVKGKGFMQTYLWSPELDNTGADLLERQLVPGTFVPEI